MTMMLAPSWLVTDLRIERLFVQGRDAKLTPTSKHHGSFLSRIEYSIKAKANIPGASLDLEIVVDGDCTLDKAIEMLENKVQTQASYLSKQYVLVEGTQIRDSNEFI